MAGVSQWIAVICWTLVFNTAVIRSVASTSLEPRVGEDLTRGPDHSPVDFEEEPSTLDLEQPIEKNRAEGDRTDESESTKTIFSKHASKIKQGLKKLEQSKDDLKNSIVDKFEDTKKQVLKKASDIKADAKSRIVGKLKEKFESIEQGLEKAGEIKADLKTRTVENLNDKFETKKQVLKKVGEIKADLKAGIVEKFKDTFDTKKQALEEAVEIEAEIPTVNILNDKVANKKLVLKKVGEIKADIKNEIVNKFKDTLETKKQGLDEALEIKTDLKTRTVDNLSNKFATKKQSLRKIGDIKEDIKTQIVDNLNDKLETKKQGLEKAHEIKADLKTRIVNKLNNTLENKKSGLEKVGEIKADLKTRIVEVKEEAKDRFEDRIKDKIQHFQDLFQPEDVEHVMDEIESHVKETEKKLTDCSKRLMLKESRILSETKIKEFIDTTLTHLQMEADVKIMGLKDDLQDLDFKMTEIDQKINHILDIVLNFDDHSPKPIDDQMFDENAEDLENFTDQEEAMPSDTDVHQESSEEELLTAQKAENPGTIQLTLNCGIELISGSEDACQSTKEFALTECEDCDAEKSREIERLEKECESPDGTVSCSRIVLHHNSDLSDCISQIITVDRKKCVSKTDGNKKPSESATVNYHGDIKNQLTYPESDDGYTKSADKQHPAGYQSNDGYDMDQPKVRTRRGTDYVKRKYNHEKLSCKDERYRNRRHRRYHSYQNEKHIGHVKKYHDDDLHSSHYKKHHHFEKPHKYGVKTLKSSESYYQPPKQSYYHYKEPNHSSYSYNKHHRSGSDSGYQKPKYAYRNPNYRQYHTAKQHPNHQQHSHY